MPLAGFSTPNESICQMLGYSREELLRMGIGDIAADESPEAVAVRMQQITRSGRAQFQGRHRRKDGKVIDVDISVQFIATLGERHFAFIRDITGAKRTRRP